MPTTDAEKIARGENPEWVETFEHPTYGQLTFRGRLPTATALLEHHVQIDNRLANLDGPPRTSTMIIVSALAGLSGSLLVECPVVAETREPDDERGSERVTKVYYDPDEETDLDFLSTVWLAFSAWRQEKLGEVDAVKGPSGETSGSASSESSSAPTGSPSTTPA